VTTFPKLPTLLEKDTKIMKNKSFALIAASLLYAMSVAAQEPLAATQSLPAADPVQDLIDNMQKDSDLPASGGNPGAYTPGIVFQGTYESVRDACAGHSNLAELLDRVVTWTWIWEGQGNKATNTRVACRHARAYWLSKSTGKWNLAFDVRPSGWVEPFTWFGGPQSGESYRKKNDNQRNEDAIVMSCKPTRDTKYELWGSACIGHEAFLDVKAWYLATDVKLIVDDPIKPDDREQAKYIVTVGADFKTSQLDKTPNAIRFGANDKRKHDDEQPDGYPNKGVSGFQCRYRLIGRDWMTVHAISMGPQYHKEYGNRPPPPWGPPWDDHAYRPTKNAWPYTRPPYVLTEDEVRANPPPFLPTSGAKQ
jgi:hypothetical protein